MIKKPSGSNGDAHRVITFLTRDELDFLDKVGKDALFIISALVNVIRKLGIDGCGLSSKKELENRVIEAMKDVSEKKGE